MLIKLTPMFHTFVRQREETPPKNLTRQQWITIDRVVMAVLFLSAVIGAVIYS